MKRATAIIISVLFLASSCSTKVFAPVETKLGKDLAVTEIAPEAFLVTHSFPWPGNSLIVRVGGKEFVWIDTPYTPGATAETLHWLSAKYGGGVKVTEINTGFHIDNLGGNAELVGRNIPVYGSTLTRELVKTRNPQTMAKMVEWLRAPGLEEYRSVYADFAFVEPTVTFDIAEDRVLRIGNERIEIFFPGPTHTYDNLVVYFRGRKLLFGGCMVLSAEASKPGFVDDGNLGAWPKSLAKVKERFPDARIVVPGHGKAGDLGLLSRTVEILERAISR